MGNKSRNQEIQRLFNIEGWTRRALLQKYDISERTLRRILNEPDETGRPPVKEEIEIFKFSLYNSEGVLIASSNSYDDFEEYIGPVSNGLSNWINETLTNYGQATIKEHTLKLADEALTANKDRQIEILQEKVKNLELTLKDIMNSTTDHAITNSIKKFMK